MNFHEASDLRTALAIISGRLGTEKTIPLSDLAQLGFYTTQPAAMHVIRKRAEEIVYDYIVRALEKENPV